MLIVIAPLLSSPANAHLLNMTKADLLILPDGRALLTLEIDLSRSMDSADAYYRLSKGLDRSDYADLWQKIGDGMNLKSNNENLPLTFLGAAQTRQYVLQDFHDPLIWPRILVTFASATGSITGAYALSLTFTRNFFYEEPIALTMRKHEDDRGINRWLVTDQVSPLLTNQMALFEDKAALSFADLLAMVRYGFSHVIPGGADHLLFLLGLSLAIGSLKKLVLALTLFTAAHSIALLAASYRLIDLSAIFVEFFILSTIAWLGFQLVRQNKASVGYTSVFLFGLVHGLGFGVAFMEYAITDNIIAQLIAFNIGVELAQIAFVLLSAVVAFKLRANSGGHRSIARFTGAALLVLPTIWMGFLLSGA